MILDLCAVLVKALLYGAVLVAAGVVFAQWTLVRDPLLERHTLICMRRASVLTLVASAAGASLLVFRLGGVDDATLAVVFSSSSGAALFMQWTGALLLLNSHQSGGTRFASAALLTLSFGFSGHAAAAGLFESIIVFLHTNAIAWWVGSLLLLRSAGANPDVFVTQLRRFSVLAGYVIAALVVTGILLIYQLVNFSTLSGLTPYLRNFAIKLVIVVGVLALAAYNRYRLTQRALAGNAQVGARMRRIIEYELLIIVAILFATAVLTTYSSPHDE